MTTTTTTQAPDELVPDPQVRKECGISEMTQYRWDHNSEMEKLGWPPKIKIRLRRN